MSDNSMGGCRQSDFLAIKSRVYFRSLVNAVISNKIATMPTKLSLTMASLELQRNIFSGLIKRW